ncbi:hypothetical protein [Natronorubrum tibetense]|uniref:Uncharacterized protein n=1 Tax=Natronorubrum tibetense GA33 TaxID=1114856 RepID=L9VRX5_9EURY|nr:hypothetical protein [Natronorubrum tibetense]ELY39806.1 hypothetical protein C496_14051 [Natronorubrum tibetense GA33]
MVVLLIATSSAAGAVSTSYDTEYHGDSEDADQAIETTFTLSPDDDEITDIQIDFQHTDDAFVDFDSFSTTTSAGADIDIQYEGNGVFTIDEIQTNEDVVFEFEAYPTDIKQEEIRSTTIEIDYVQQGQGLSETEHIDVDISSSPWFLYQEEVSEDEFWDRAGSVISIGTFGAFAVGLLGLATAGVFYVRSANRVKSARQTLVKKLKRLENQVESERATTKIRDTRKELEDGNTGDPTPSTEDGPELRP